MIKGLRQNEAIELRTGELILAGAKLAIACLSIGENWTRVGIKAPQSIRIATKYADLSTTGAQIVSIRRLQTLEVVFLVPPPVGTTVKIKMLALEDAYARISILAPCGLLQITRVDHPSPTAASDYAERCVQ